MLILFLCGLFPADTHTSEILETAQAVHKHITEDVKDYTGLLVKRELVDGVDTGYQYIQFKYRENPRAIYLKFLKPPSIENREVLYSGGDDLIVKHGGRRNSNLTLTIAVDSPAAIDGNRYTIKDMGLRALSDRLMERLKTELDIPDTEITYYPDAKVDKRDVKFYRLKHHVRSEQGQCYIAEIAVDKEYNVPTYYRAFGYGTNDEPILLEEYSFRNIRINVNLTDKDFDINNAEYGFQK